MSVEYIMIQPLSVGFGENQEKRRIQEQEFALRDGIQIKGQGLAMSVQYMGSSGMMNVRRKSRDTCGNQVPDELGSRELAHEK
ncbi:uncharacterized protein SAPINGB_P002975 [Magnusiomyces paraingens]|uniref:Uncharacterized protein n=1 Tax=Magnusiomyces paraingens TaxID=2606893 RepID=A0A5E8BHE6_9ASCO|nr:uncharacterized protein SAPINGB_P002975 [Saprochaete ingens]VVT51074.1 unnamed protein product [Saprochaete ingens]